MQFILIMHNRKIMEIVDRLYGVMMEEFGVWRSIMQRLLGIILFGGL